MSVPPGEYVALVRPLDVHVMRDLPRVDGDGCNATMAGYGAKGATYCTNWESLASHVAACAARRPCTESATVTALLDPVLVAASTSTTGPKPPCTLAQRQFEAGVWSIAKTPVNFDRDVTRTQTKPYTPQVYLQRLFSSMTRRLRRWALITPN